MVAGADGRADLGDDGRRAVARGGRAHPSAPALVEVDVEGESGRRWTYGELLADSERLAHALCTRFSPGERVVVWAPNIPEWVLVEYACALAGLVLVTANPSYQARELRYVLEHSGAVALFLVESYRGNPMGVDRGHHDHGKDTVAQGHLRDGGGRLTTIDLVCGYIPTCKVGPLNSPREWNDGQPFAKGEDRLSARIRTPQDTRVFMNGRSQAVRLPKEFRFDADRVAIWREGRHVVLSPMFKDWDDYLENGARFTDDFFEAMEEIRDTHLPLEDREPFD